MDPAVHTAISQALHRFLQEIEGSLRLQDLGARVWGVGLGPKVFFPE